MKTGTRTQVALTKRFGISRILRLSSRSFCSSSVSSDPSSTIDPARGITLWAIVAGNLTPCVEREGRRRRRRARARRASRVFSSWSASSLDAVAARAAHRLVGRDDHRRAARPPGAAASAPASRPSSCSWGWRRCPWGWRASACAFTSGTTRGTSGSIRHADELSMTMAPAAARRGDRTLDDVAPDGRQRDVDAREVGRRGVLDGDRAALATRASCRPSAPRRRTASSSTGKSRSARIVAHHGADLAGGSDDGDAHGGSLGHSASRPNALCRARTASATRSARSTHEMRIELVEIISMLMPLFVERLEHRAPSRRGSTSCRRRRCDTRPMPSSLVTDGRVDVVGAPLGRPPWRRRDRSWRR